MKMRLEQIKVPNYNNDKGIDFEVNEVVSLTRKNLESILIKTVDDDKSEAEKTKKSRGKASLDLKTIKLITINSETTREQKFKDFEAFKESSGLKVANPWEEGDPKDRALSIVVKYENNTKTTKTIMMPCLETSV